MVAISKSTVFLIRTVQQCQELGQSEWLQYMELFRQEIAEIVGLLGFVSLGEMAFLSGGPGDGSEEVAYHTLIDDLGAEQDYLSWRGLFAAKQIVSERDKKDATIVEGRKHYPGHYALWGLTDRLSWFVCAFDYEVERRGSIAYYRAINVAQPNLPLHQDDCVKEVMNWARLSPAEVCDTMYKLVLDSISRRHSQTAKAREDWAFRGYEAEVRRVCSEVTAQ